MRSPIPDSWILDILKTLLPADAYTSVTQSATHSYWQAAVDAGLVTDAQLLSAAAHHTHLRPLDADCIPSPTARTILSKDLARRYATVPLKISDTTITIAVANPFNLDAEQAIGFLTGRRVDVFLASPLWIAQQIDTLYNHESSTDKLLDNVRATYAGISSPTLSNPNAPTEHEGNALTNRPIVQLVDYIVADGHAKRASDIHLEPEEHGVTVKYRIDGVLQQILILPQGVGLPLVSRIKIMAQMDIADRLRPQGGRIRVTIHESTIDLRVSTLPASLGEKVVIRILDPQGSIRSLDTLDLPPRIAARLQKLLDLREGLILITGPTGSGKTTTLYAALQRLRERGLNIITVEDPVEYRVPGIVQVQVNEKADLTFAAALRSILRQDPDVVLIGEVRDRETAAIAIQAALTGHLVFATLHTIDASSSIARLQDLGVDPQKISAALKGVIAQRLLRRLCTACAKPTSDPVPPHLWHVIPSGAHPLGPTGCQACSQTGYHGRIAVTELIPITHDLEHLIAISAPISTLIANARQAGALSLWDAGIAAVLDGITSADEVARVLDASDQPVPFTESEPNDEPHPDIHPADDESPTDPPKSHPTRAAPQAMTTLVPNIVDVYLVDPTHTPWHVLVLQRSLTTIRPNSWETVHGKVDPGETPTQAAIREVSEETGLSIQHLYNVTVHSFYIHKTDTIHSTIVFCGIVDSSTPITLSDEHRQYTWMPITKARERFTWPRAKQMLQEIEILLQPETLSTVHDVIQVF